MILLDDLAKHQLVELVDDYSVRAVLAALEEICDDEANRLLTGRYDVPREGEFWHYAGQEISKMRLKVQV